MGFTAPPVSSASLVVDGPTLVSRQRLVERVSLAARAPVIAITGPAASGKSVLVDQWAASRPDLPVVVLQLGPDDDRAAFTHRTVDAVVERGIRASGRMQAASGGVSAVLDEVARSGPLAVVLDDFDAPSAPDLVGDLTALALERRPGVHLVVTARSRRVPQLALLRRRDDVAELDHRELAFTADEVRDLVRRGAGRELADHQVAELLDRTDGWAVAVQVAAVALRGGKDADEVIATISGENPRIGAVLTTEVLGGLSPAVRRFLVRTSVLDPLTGPVCDAVTDRPAGALTLRFLEQSGVPVEGVAQHPSVFRYSRLLRERLQHELRMSGAGAEREILRGAAWWHAAHADPEPAARYFAAAEDWDALVALVDTYGQRWFERGEADRVLRWLAALPAGVAARETGTALRLAYLETATGRTRRAEQRLRDVESRGADRATALCVDALRATWAFIDASPAAAATAAERALDRLDRVADDELPDILGLTNRASLGTMAAGSLAKSAWLAGDVGSARRGIRRLLARDDLIAPWRVHLLSAMALLEAWEGNLGIAEWYARAAIRIARVAGLGQHPALADSFVALAHVRRERGDLVRAWTVLQRGNGVATRVRRPTTQAAHTVELAASCLAAGAPGRGLDAVRRYWLTGDPPPPIVGRNLQAIAVQSLLAAGRVEQARSLLPVGELPRPAELATVSVALTVAEGSLDAAEAELSSWPSTDGRTRSALDKQLWTAIVELERGRRHEAVRIAAEALAASEAEGHCRFVLDAGAPGLQLLRAVLHAAPSEHARRIAQAAAVREVPAIAAVDLSERELEVVRYLPTPLSNAEMAARLYVSLNTLKTHLRAIYRKLGVNGRREAIRRAEELGIA
jgi:LuxR family maltose regulon positive regulatory protein